MGSKVVIISSDWSTTEESPNVLKCFKIFYCFSERKKCFDMKCLVWAVNSCAPASSWLRNNILRRLVSTLTRSPSSDKPLTHLIATRLEPSAQRQQARLVKFLWSNHIFTCQVRYWGWWGSVCLQRNWSQSWRTWTWITRENSS